MDTIADHYQRDGYFFPVDIMTKDEAARYRVALELAEQDRSGDPALDSLLESALSGFANMVLPFADDISRLPSVLAPVKEILGPDLLVWGASLFLKEAQSPEYISWHQDLTYWDLDDASEVTAWVALSSATVESGCMRFLPGSHAHSIVEHRDTFSATNMLSRGQEIAIKIDEATTVDVVLEPGQMSLHHGHMFHASHANRSDDRRIGLAIRYITPAMRQKSGIKTCAHLVAGEDRYGNFELLDPPSGTLTGGDLATVRYAISLQEKFLYEGAAEQGKRLL